MRFGRLLLIVLVVLAFPAGAAAEPARLAKQAQMEPAPEPKPEPKRVGRPRVVELALRYLGTPYRWAGASPSGFDCSGFVMYVYGRVGVSLPHNAAQLWGLGRAVPRDRLLPGDLVFFSGLGHVGIYVGRGRFVHSPQSGDVVKISPLGEGWYRSSYYGARRLG